ncbi:MAG: helix-turn-helix transcriptional regulator [Clostridia bacterium]|nr:helix-turn-helix transcriptional regulator [Clostridia bacterium]
MEVYKAKNYIQGELSLHIFEETVVDHSVSLHIHEQFTEIVYITSGECLQTINGVSYTAKRGDLFFINLSSTHSFSPINSFTYYNICFSPATVVKRIIDRQNALDLISLSTLEEIQSESVPICRFTFGGEERLWVEALLKDMHKEYTSNESERNAILESYMTIMIAKILRKAHEANVTKRKELSDVWRALSEFIDENLDQKLTLEDLAQQCFYNPSYFSRAFKRKFGVSPMEYITRERVFMAASLLQNESLSMEELAEQCGFGDKSSLYRAFEKHYGCTPSAYRKALKT